MPRPVSARFPALRPASVTLGLALVLLALMGGSSRYDVPGLTLLRPVLAIMAGLLALLRVPASRVRLGTLLLLLGLLGAVIAMQLVPLPPALWTSLPQRGRYLLAATIAGEPQPWRPISIVPVLTLNALLALVPAAAVLVGFARLNAHGQRLVVPALLVLAGASAVLGILQISIGGVYLYARTTIGLPEGLFANRNHQAVLLAGSLPLFTAWTFARAGERRGSRPSPARIATAVTGALLVLLVVLATESRSGLLLGGLDLVGAAYLILVAPGTGAARRPRRATHVGLVVLGGGLVVVAVAAWFGRGSGFSRFLALREPGAEMRFRAWPILRQLMGDYFPWGSGFGTFDPLFRAHEPDVLLNPSYFNAAHNDLVELVITGGVSAVLVLGAFLVWAGWRVVAVFRARDRSPELLDARAGAMMLVTLLLASLSDYPLRTPLAGAVLALAAALLERGAQAIDRA